MNASSLSRLLVLAVACTAIAGCAGVDVGREAQRSDGLFQFMTALAGHPRRDVAPVETRPSASMDFTLAYATAHRGKTYVRGYVKRRGFGWGAPGAHVDVIVRDSDGRPLSSAATTYLPRGGSRPRRMLGAPFTVGFPFGLPAGSTVEVIHHNAPRSRCPLAHDS